MKSKIVFTLLGIAAILMIASLVGNFGLDDNSQSAVVETSNLTPASEVIVEGAPELSEVVDIVVEDPEIEVVVGVTEEIAPDVTDNTVIQPTAPVVVEPSPVPVEEVVPTPVVAAAPGQYVEYAAPITGKTNVLSFAALAWCPSCRAFDASIKQNLSQIPSDLVIHKVDYDTATALKQKYGVTIQHTFVQIDDNGNLIKKWIGGGSLEDVVAQL